MQGGTPATQEEPAPKASEMSIVVWPLVIHDVTLMGYDALAHDMNARHEEGTRKYGTPLTSHNGRRALVDAYQESLDGAVYLRQAIVEMGEVEAIMLHSANNLEPRKRQIVTAYLDALSLCERLRVLAVGDV